MRSLEFEEGDEILVPDHAYQACRNAIDFVAERWGVNVVTVHIPFPIESMDEIVNLVQASVTEKTVFWEPIILFAAIKILSEANLVAPYKLIGFAALSVDKAMIFFTFW
mgnify:CR=1 FL=1